MVALHQEVVKIITRFWLHVYSFMNLHFMHAGRIGLHNCEKVSKNKLLDTVWTKLEFCTAAGPALRCQPKGTKYVTVRVWPHKTGMTKSAELVLPPDMVR